MLDPLQNKQYSQPLPFEAPAPTSLPKSEVWREPVLQDGQQVLGPSGFPLWLVDIKCAGITCTSIRTIEVERSNAPGDPTIGWLREQYHNGRCHCCLDSYLNGITRDEEVIEVEWPGYDQGFVEENGKEGTKCCCPDCLRKNPSRVRISPAERSLRKMYALQGKEVPPEKLKELKMKTDMREGRWVSDPKKSHQENMESWQNHQQEQLEKAFLLKQESDILLRSHPEMQAKFGKKEEPKKPNV